MLFAEAETRASPLSRRADQPIWRDPATHYLRRHVSPPGTGSPVDIVEVEFPPRGSVAFDNQRLAGADQHVWVLDGTLELELGEEVFRLDRGDCLLMRFDRPILFRNPTGGPSATPSSSATEPRGHDDPATSAPSTPREAEARLGELADILVDAVAHGASVNFMAGFSADEGRAFWRSQLAGHRRGREAALVGDDGARLVATVLLTFAHQPNAPHRAEIGKMLVLSSARRQGLGRRLLRPPRRRPARPAARS